MQYYIDEIEPLIIERKHYDEVQEVNERRKRRILAYYEYIDARTRDQIAEVVHKLTEQSRERMRLR